MAGYAHDYIELHAHTAFSFLDGASQPDELVLAAAELGYTHFAVTDHDNLCGALEFAGAAKAAGVRPITGAEVTVEDELGRLCHVTLVVRTGVGYANLCRLLTQAYRPRGLAALAAATEVDATALTRQWLADADREAERERGAANWRGAGRARGGAGGGPRRGGKREQVPGRPPSQSALVRGSALRPDPLVTLAQLCEHAPGLTLLTGCASRGLLAGDLAAARPSRAAATVERLQAAFGSDDVYVELQLPQQRGDAERVRALRHVAEACHAPVVATGNVHAHTLARGRLHEALVAVRLNTTLEACEGQRDGNLARVLRSPADMARRFVDHPDAVRSTRVIAERIEFDLTAGVGYRYPDMTDGTGQSADELLAGITIAELDRRYAGRQTAMGARVRLDEELRVIRRHGLSGFFLLHRDILELAREVAREVRGDGSHRNLNPPGRGRGSSVESIVCYLTGLSHVDPLEANLRMGRFLNEDMVSVPDIDLDFPRDIRHGLLARVVERYGARRCAMVAAHATYRTKGTIRDMGRVLGLPQAELARIASRSDSWGGGGIDEALGAEHAGPRWDAFRMLASEVGRLPRVMSQHSGGVIVSTEPLEDVVPIQPAATPGRQLVQWDKDSCSDAGFLKIDVLGLGMLSAVEEVVDTIARTGGARGGGGATRGRGSWVVDGGIDLSRIPLDDRAVYAEIAEGDTVGTFQIESRAQIQSLRRVRPENLDDLVVQVALIRPGPIIGQSVNPYVAIREALRVDPATPIPYDHPLLEPVLKDTYGAIVFQDQVIEVSMAIAGFTAGEADGLRRAMTRKRAAGSVEAWRPRFIEGAERRGVKPAIANGVFDKVIGFCHYGFPRAHSVAFALLAYQSSWLRHYYPAHFHAALINAQPMGFYPADSLLRDAARHGVAALAVDVNTSDALCTVEQLPAREAAALSFGRRRSGEAAHPAIRVGIGCVNGVGYADALALQRERERGGPFLGIEDLLRRAPLRTDQVERLVMAGACDSLAREGGGRRELLWQVGLVARPRRAGQGSATRAVDELAPAAAPHTEQEVLEITAPDGPTLPQLSLWDEVVLDFSTQGLSVRAHPVGLLRPLLGPKVVTIEDALDNVPNGRLIEVVGAVTARQQPGTAKGMVFLLMEDETGQLNVIVSPQLYKEQRTTIRGEPMLRVVGRLERHDRVVNLVAREAHRLPRELRERSPKRMKAKNFG
ncbi:MAG: DNA polymerase III subunit alpha [Thermoleophilia bacterium]|nr:DNA polymerase III subunit alpha [Thermoleophilia bacterium]